MPHAAPIAAPRQGILEGSRMASLMVWPQPPHSRLANRSTNEAKLGRRLKSQSTEMGLGWGMDQLPGGCDTAYNSGQGPLPTLPNEFARAADGRLLQDQCAFCPEYIIYARRPISSF